MRSSIACSRCRRSKIKCVNSGIDTTCRACESSGRECVYPTPSVGAGGGGAAAAAGGASKRDISALADGDDRNGDWDSPKRQRPRKSMTSAGGVGKDGSKANGLVLDSSLLTVKVWESLFELFQLHFSTTLPFLHPTTFLSQIRQVSSLSSNTTTTSTQHPDGQLPKDHHPQSPSSRAGTSASPLILLGILTLTARFHPQLVQHHSPSSAASSSNPLAASEYYANALRAKLAGAEVADLAAPDISRVQALLMLGLHEWGMCHGKSAWLYTGMAIRMAQGMGLGFESENDEQPLAQPPSIRDPLKDQNSDGVIDQETRRRTFWSCFMLDRCVSNGKYRPRMIRVRDIGIQLPSDNAFAFGERVRTSRLCETSTSRRRSQGYDGRECRQIPGLRQSSAYPEEQRMRAGGTVESKHWSTSSHRSDGAEHGIDRWEVGAEESVLGRLIRIVRVWGSIAKWSCAGARKADQFPPWHPESRFSCLRELLIEFQDGLSRNLRYSPRNTDTHIMYKNTLAPYSLMHIIYFLSVIVLHRTYLPFLPVRAHEPIGPDDEPSFPPDKYSIPDGFWRDSAREVFKASRQMMELVRVCHDRGVLVETPLVGFAIYNAALIGVYALNFNHMDQEGYVCSKPNSTDVIRGVGGQGQADTRKAIEVLADMRRRLKMAVGWFRTVHRLNSYSARAKREYKLSTRSVDTLPHESDVGVNGKGGIQQPPSPRFGSNPDESKLMDKLLAQLGSNEDQVPEVLNGADEDVARVHAHAPAIEHGPSSETASNPVKSESGNELDGQTDGAGHRSEPWASVNSPGQGLLPPSAKEAGDRDTTRVEYGPMHRPSDSDRWPNLPPPQTTYSLPSIQPTPTSSPGFQPPPLPPSTASPSSYPYTSTGVSSSIPPPYLPTPSSSNRLQPLQSLPPPSSSRPGLPLPPYSQSLPSLNAAAQHGFSMPPLPSSSSLQPSHSHSHHQHQHHHQHHPHRLTPPPTQRLEYAAPPRASGPGEPGLASGGSAWSIGLGGDDVIAFIAGEGFEQCASTDGGGLARAGVPTGWLKEVWSQSGQ